MRAVIARYEWACEEARARKLAHLFGVDASPKYRRRTSGPRAHNAASQNFPYIQSTNRIPCGSKLLNENVASASIQEERRAQLAKLIIIFVILSRDVLLQSIKAHWIRKESTTRAPHHSLS